MVDISEKSFEAQIEHILRNSNGFHKRTSSVTASESEYDAELCLIPRDTIDFILATQPDEWQKIHKAYGDDARRKFLLRLCGEIEKRGTLDVLRNGVKDAGAKIRLVYFRPASRLNTDEQRRYEANTFSLIRQVYYKPPQKLSLDMVIFLNGLPLFTVELKNHFTGQTVQHAMTQYRRDRDPRDPLFQFKRCLIHFAVDPDLVYMTARLNGDKTQFLPFNKGRHGGAGNMAVANNFATHYLWEEVWTKNSILDLLDNFIHAVDEEDDKGKKTGERVIIPRYHQLDAVRRLLADARTNGTGRRYLIQHSAGSGKSYSIAWLAHQLARLHNDQDERVFDSVIIITDRRVLDKQLQQSVRQFEQVRGTVENIDQTSRQLKQALADGKQIIVTTLQKFPVIVREMQELGAKAGNRFAVIVDEAHSSQSGESVTSLKKVLATTSLEDAEAEEGDEPRTWEDNINDEAAARKFPPNISVFAFTATPKPKTLELFGIQRPDGKYAPFSLYSMRQAIEEGFILDVLQNYTTYRAYWRLLKKIDDDPEYETSKAKSLLRRFVELHPHAINEKVAIIVEHFHENVAHRINKQAKAMIVTRSRLHAVRYFLALREYLKENGYPYKAMVAFSGTVKDGAGDYTEAELNGFPENQTANRFKDNDYKFLVVAEKFQTGFDQPLLYAMYVDKVLSGVHAVQTLSRLNRTLPPLKDATVVLDFANDAENIQQAFAPYYEQTLLSEGTDPNLLYDREGQLREFNLFTEDEVQGFAALYFTPGMTQEKLHAPLDPIVERYKQLEPEDQAQFRAQLSDFIRLYAFLSQIIPFEDVDLEALYVFLKFLRRKLPIERDELPVEVLNAIDIDSYRIRQTSSGKVTPQAGDPILTPMEDTRGAGYGNDLKTALSMIIAELNERFGTDLDEAAKASIEHVFDCIRQSDAVANSFKVNDPDKARLTFVSALEYCFNDVYESNFNLYRQVADNESFKTILFDWLLDRYLSNKAS